MSFRKVDRVESYLRFLDRVEEDRFRREVGLPARRRVSDNIGIGYEERRFGSYPGPGGRVRSSTFDLSLDVDDDEKRADD